MASFMLALDLWQLFQNVLHNHIPGICQLTTTDWTWFVLSLDGFPARAAHPMPLFTLVYWGLHHGFQTHRALEGFGNPVRQSLGTSFSCPTSRRHGDVIWILLCETVGT